jgi:hypothetical protein
MKWIIEGVLDAIYIEDSGHSIFAEMTKPEFIGSDFPLPDDEHLFVRIQSHHDFDLPKPIKHPIMDMIKNKKVRVTIEIID